MSRSRRPVLRACLSIALGALTLAVPLAGSAQAATAVVRDDTAASTPAEEDVTIDVLTNDSGVGPDDYLDVTGSSANGADVYPDGRVIHFRAHLPGTDTFTYTVYGPDGSARGSAKVTVPVTRAKVVSARDDEYDAEKDTVTTLPATENDTTGAEGGRVVASVTDPPFHGTVSVVTDADDVPSFEYTPVAGYEGNDAFNYQLEDTAGHHDDGTVTLHVQQVGVRDLGVRETGDGAALRWRLPHSAAFRGLAVRLSDGVPGGGASAPETVADGTPVSVGDGSTSMMLSGLTRDSEYAVSVFARYADGSFSEPSSRWFTPTVQPVRELSSDGTAATVTLGWRNPPGSTSTRITYENASGTTKRVTTGPGVTTATVGSLVNGHTYDFSVQASVAGTFSEARETSATPTARANRAPVAAADLVSLHGDDPVSFYVVGNDTDPDAADASSLGIVPVDPSDELGDYGDVECDSSGTCTYTPTAASAHDDSFTYRLTDGHGGRAVGQVNLRRRSVQAQDDSFTTSSTTGRVLDVLANDTGKLFPDDQVTLDDTTTSLGTFDPSYTDDGRPAISFEPNGSPGSTAVAYRVRDENGHTIARATATVQVQLAPTVTVAVTNPVTPAGTAVRFGGRATRVGAGAPVRLERMSGAGAWTIVKAATFASGATPTAGAPYSFTVTETATGYPAYRVVVPASGALAETAQQAGALTIVKATLPSMRRTANEYVTVKNPGASEYNLKGWTITTKAGKKLTLPRTILLPGHSVRIHPGSGSTTAADVYLRRGASFGNAHDRLRLRTQYGALAATKTY